MRGLIALVLLLLQGSPLVGVALCLHAASAPSAECDMAGQDTGSGELDAVSGVLSAAGDLAPDECRLAAACAAPAPAVIVAAPVLRRAATPLESVPTRLHTLHPGETRALPHNPPRA